MSAVRQPRDVIALRIKLSDHQFNNFTAYLAYICLKAS